jgi:signal transduction histidine kinase
MDLSRRNMAVYGLLAALWVFVVAWQVEEHFRFKNYAKKNLRTRSQSIANTLGASIRGIQIRGAVFGDRLQPVLNAVLNEMVNGATNELSASAEVMSVVLLNNEGKRVAYAGRTPELEQREIPQETERWGLRTVTFVYPIEGAVNQEGQTNVQAPVFLPGFTNRDGRGPRRGPPGEPRPAPGDQGPPPGDLRHPPDGSAPININADPATLTNHPTDVATEGGSNPPVNSVPPPRPERGPRPEGAAGRRPFWAHGLSEQEIQEKELHGLVLVMPIDALHAGVEHDLWLRFVIALFATISVIGSGLAWRNLTTTSELQLRLVRASELNTHLKEMNLAAAGLAHETRNPLNIIRGLAQMISKKPETVPEVREKSTEIIHEADKVAAQLNEFINYSRPREVRPAKLAVQTVVNEVVRALGYDAEEKKVTFEVTGDPLTIEADEQLLRQALFNLLLNSVQAAEPTGKIEICAQRSSASEASLEVRDDGPGVAAENRSEIFKPYFTTQKHGTGLGLAVVQQIVLAHGWEIECLANQPRGAIFRVRHIKLA